MAHLRIFKTDVQRFVRPGIKSNPLNRIGQEPLALYSNILNPEPATYGLF